MKYFLDTEFLEGTQKEKFPINLFKKNTINTIDLISIGIVSENNKEYYAISKDFNLKEAWNRYQIKDALPESNVHGKIKEYWIRKNVLKPIFHEFIEKEFQSKNKQERILGYSNDFDKTFSFKNFKRLLKKYGKTNQEIAKEIKRFVNINDDGLCDCSVFTTCVNNQRGGMLRCNAESLNISFYAYYADYDWVVFCWIFGNMINLPKGFPMYCNDLKQTLDRVSNKLFLLNKHSEKLLKFNGYDFTKVEAKNSNEYLKAIKNLSNFPQQENEHNALADAKWNKKLYEFLKTL